jgi:hypothetical protein
MVAVGKLRLVGTGMAAAMALAGCSGNDNSGSTDITPAQAAVIGSAAVDQLGGLANGLSHFNTPGVGGLGSGFFAPAAPGGRVLASALGRLNPRIGRSLALIARADNCVPDESDATDTDGDGIQDDNVVTFTAANCTLADTTEQGEPLTVTVTGTVRIQDTDGINTLFGYRVGIAGFTVTVADTITGTPDLAVSVTGGFDADVQGSLANASQNLRTSLRLDGTRVFGDHANWALGYTPTTGTITLGSETLPAGDFTVNGSYDWNGAYNNAEGDWSFSLQTPLALAWDGSCDDDQWPFDSGQLKGSITARRSVGFTVDYAGCGMIGTITAYGITALRS